MFTLDRATFQANETHLLSVVCWHNEGPDPAKFNISLDILCLESHVEIKHV